MKQTKKELIWEMIRFLIVGGIATLVDYAVFYLCNLVLFKPIDTNVNLVLSTALGFTFGLLTNWFLQKFVYRYITKDQQRSKLVFLKFVVLSLIGFGITWVGMQLSTPLHDDVLIDFLFLHNIQLIFWIFKVVLTIIVLIINYVGRKLFVFNQKDEISNIESNHEIDKELEKEKNNN
jgi:putative flippase GtrA